MATRPSSHIPLFYRILFTYVDPFFCTLGFTMHLFSPSDTMRGYSPTFTHPADLATIHLLDSIAGFFAFLGILEAALLRARSQDVAVWRIVQGSASMVDICMVLGAYKMLSMEGRLMDIGSWRGDDWRLLVGNAVAGALRIACALGIGMGTVSEERKTA